MDLTVTNLAHNHIGLPPYLQTALQLPLLTRTAIRTVQHLQNTVCPVDALDLPLKASGNVFGEERIMWVYEVATLFYDLFEYTLLIRMQIKQVIVPPIILRCSLFNLLHQNGIVNVPIKQLLIAPDKEDVGWVL